MHVLLPYCISQQQSHIFILANSFVPCTLTICITACKGVPQFHACSPSLLHEPEPQFHACSPSFLHEPAEPHSTNLTSPHLILRSPSLHVCSTKMCQSSTKINFLTNPNMFHQNTHLLTSPHLTSPHLTSPYLTLPHLTSPHLTFILPYPPHLTAPTEGNMEGSIDNA